MVLGLFTWKGEVGLTTVSAPINSEGGLRSTAAISLMKLATMPMMAMRETSWHARMTVNVMPRAPSFGP